MPVQELVNFRQKYPQYSDISDIDLATKLATKFPQAYGDLPKKAAMEANKAKPSAMQGGANAPALVQARQGVQAAKRQNSPFSIFNQGMKETARQIASPLPFGKMSVGTQPVTPRNVVGEGLKAASFIPAVGPVVGGASYMTGQALEDPTKSAGGVALQAGIGAATGGAFKVAGKAIQAVIPKPIHEKIFELYNKAIGTKIRQPSEATTVKASKVNVVKTISDNLPNIKLPNLDTGVMESRIPKTREENLLAFQQAKDLIWKNNVTRLSQGATAKGAQINLPSLVDKSLAEAKKNIGSVALKANPGLEKALDNTAVNIKKVGVIDPTKSQEYLKYLNDQIMTLRKSGQAVDFSRKDLLNSLRFNLANETDDVIEKTLGQSGYSEARKQYADLRGAQSEIVSAANKYYRQHGQGGGFVHPIVDLWSLEEILQSGGHALTGNIPMAAGNLARAATVKGASKLVDFMRSPDRKIEEMYKLASKYKRPSVPVKTKPLALPGPTKVGGGIQLPYTTQPTLMQQPFKNIKSPSGMNKELSKQEAKKYFKKRFPNMSKESQKEVEDFLNQ